MEEERRVVVNMHLGDCDLCGAECVVAHIGVVYKDGDSYSHDDIGLCRYCALNISNSLVDFSGKYLNTSNEMERILKDFKDSFKVEKGEK